MGGVGSGNWYRLDKKGTTDGCHSLDVRDLHRDGLILSYGQRSGLGSEWEDVKEPVSLEWTPCNFGGERPWFLCPGAGCGRRVAVLYGPGATSYAATATTCDTKASGRTRRTVPYGERKGSGRGSGAAP